MIFYKKIITTLYKEDTKTEEKVMSKMGQAVFEAQTFAQEHYNMNRDAFVQIAKSQVMFYDAAIVEFDTINEELSAHYASEPFVEPVFDEDGIPF